MNAITCTTVGAVVGAITKMASQCNTDANLRLALEVLRGVWPEIYIPAPTAAKGR